LRCELKTARLFEAATQLGAFGAGRDDLAEPMREFGRRVGLAFQMADDVLDVVGDPAVTGKPRGTDLLDGTVNLPLIVARERDPTLAGLDLRSVATSESAAEICDRIAATGATDEVLRRARSAVDAAKADLLDRLPRAEQPVFELIADQSVGRSL
jgi:geranylgeranyl pyrophosphate synthase